MIQAIPTAYNGTRFRSRLEASYAKHFDQRGMPWVYEPEAFTLSNGVNYLPDFWLPTARAWVEIKGPHNERVDKVQQFAADLNGSGASVALVTTPWREYVMTSDRQRTFRSDDRCYAYPFAIHGGGNRSPATFAKCVHCHEGVIVTFTQQECPHCAADYADTLAAECNQQWQFLFPFDYIRSDYKR